MTDRAAVIPAAAHRTTDEGETVSHPDQAIDHQRVAAEEQRVREVAEAAARAEQQSQTTQDQARRGQ